MSKPNKEELAEIKRATKEVGMIHPRAVAIAITAFDKGDFTADTVDSWSEQQRDVQPKLWLANDPEVVDAAADEDHATKFQTLKGQGELLAQFGPAKTKEIGDRIGAKIGVLGSTIVKPRGDVNPWKLPTDTPEAAAKAQAAIVDHIKRRGSAISASMAKSANKRIDGSPLKT